jgi:molybdopterin converting factor small subunit
VAKVNFYAAAKAAAGRSSEEISAPNLGALIDELISRSPELAKLIPTCSYLLNGESCQELAQVLTAEDNIDVLPQFAGG